MHRQCKVGGSPQFLARFKCIDSNISISTFTVYIRRNDVLLFSVFVVLERDADVPVIRVGDEQPAVVL